MLVRNGSVMLSFCEERIVVEAATNLDDNLLLVLRSTSQSSKKTCQPLTSWNSVQINDIMKSDSDLMI